MNYAATIPGPGDPDYCPSVDPALTELLSRITDRHGLDDLPDRLHDLVSDLVMVLYDDGRGDKDSPAATADVIAFIDEAHGILHTVRERAITENRRRMDVAMERSAKLLGLDEDGGDR